MMRMFEETCLLMHFLPFLSPIKHRISSFMMISDTDTLSLCSLLFCWKGCSFSRFPGMTNEDFFPLLSSPFFHISSSSHHHTLTLLGNEEGGEGGGEAVTQKAV